MDQAPKRILGREHAKSILEPSEIELVSGGDWYGPGGEGGSYTGGGGGGYGVGGPFPGGGWAPNTPPAYCQTPHGQYSYADDCQVDG